MKKLYTTQTVDLSDEEITKVAGGYIDFSDSAVEILT